MALSVIVVATIVVGGIAASLLLRQGLWRRR
jgi:hypothetical protein